MKNIFKIICSCQKGPVSLHQIITLHIIYDYVLLKISSMYLKEQIKKMFDIAQELEEVCVNEGFLSLIKEVNKEQDENDKYNLSDVLSFVSDVDDAIQHNYPNMDNYYDDY